MSDTTRIAKNTLMLYFRQIMIMLVSLYTVRVVLETLGGEDYGIYNIVGGVVVICGFVVNAMADTSRRYISFELGRNEFEQVKKIFDLNRSIYILIGLLVLFLAETIGLWFINNKLVISIERMYAVQWIYQFSILSFLCSIIATPYMALIIAYEDMNIYAYVAIGESILKLGNVYLLPYIPVDKLQLYGILQFIIAFINMGIYISIGKIKYKECTFSFYWNSNLFKEMAIYTGWSLFGWLANVCKNHAGNILLNQFFNPAIVASRILASSINNAVTGFSLNFNMAIRPQIIKKYALGKLDEMFLYTLNGSKGTYFLMFLFTLPLVLEMPIILLLWLKDPPEYTIIFTRLMLIDILINTITYPLGTAVSATGKMKLYSSVCGGLQLLNFPFALLTLHLGFPAYSICIVAIFITCIIVITQLFLVRFLIGFSIRKYFNEVILRLIIVSVISIILPYGLCMLLKQNILRLCLVAVVSFISACGCMYLIGLNKMERVLVNGMVIKKLLRREYL